MAVSLRSRIALVAVAGCSLTMAGCRASETGGPDEMDPSTTQSNRSPATTAAQPATTISPVVGPRACDLLTENELEPIFGFVPTRWGDVARNAIGPGMADNCYFGRTEQVFFGPVLQVSTFPPGSSLESSTTGLVDVAPVEGLGRNAFLGTVPTTPDQDPNTVMVETNHGLYGLSARVDLKLSREQLVDLARRAGDRYAEEIPR